MLILLEGIVENKLDKAKVTSMGTDRNGKTIRMFEVVDLCN